MQLLHKFAFAGFTRGKHSFSQVKWLVLHKLFCIKTLNFNEKYCKLPKKSESANFIVLNNVILFNTNIVQHCGHCSMTTKIKLVIRFSSEICYF